MSSALKNRKRLALPPEASDHVRDGRDTGLDTVHTNSAPCPNAPWVKRHGDAVAAKAHVEPQNFAYGEFVSWMRSRVSVNVQRSHALR